MSIEAPCTTGFIKSLKALGVKFAYKIPDTPRTQRFAPTKPCDAIFTLPPYGRALHIEFKAERKIVALGSQLRPAQITGLEANHAMGGLSLVIYFCKHPTGKWGLLAIPWAQYGERLCAGNSIKAHELKKLDWIMAPKTPLGGEAVFDLTDFLNDAKNGFLG